MAVSKADTRSKLRCLLIGSSSAQEALTPAPASSAGVASPYSAVGFTVARRSYLNWRRSDRKHII
ncbi:hypothetical protein OROHE_000218 [Orobanche hederae]